MLFCDETASTAIFPGIFLSRPDIVVIQARVIDSKKHVGRAKKIIR
jgi:hypothetical protein